VNFAFIQVEKASTTPAGTVSELCRALMVSRAGFSSWNKRPESGRAKDDCLLGENAYADQLTDDDGNCCPTCPRNRITPPPGTRS
jgi:hypothetical protein